MLVKGNDEDDIPRWSNYRMGYQIMESYLKQHPDESVADWNEKGSEAIVKDSDYHSIVD